VSHKSSAHMLTAHHSQVGARSCSHMVATLCRILMLGLKYVFVMNFLLLCLSTSCIRSWAYTLKFACALNIQINSYPFEKALPSYVLILLNNGTNLLSIIITCCMNSNLPLCKLLYTQTNNIKPPFFDKRKNRVVFMY